VRHSLDDHASPEWRRIGRCWLGVLLIVMITGPVLALAGIGGSLWALAGFLVIFGLASAPLIVRGLRPTVTLVSSLDERPTDMRALSGVRQAARPGG
jgi:hypothetical protein